MRRSITLLADFSGGCEVTVISFQISILYLRLGFCNVDGYFICSLALA
jgi:hypothetical protein